MSTEHDKSVAQNGCAPQNDDVSFEARDVRSTPILKFLAYLGVAIVLCYLLTFGIYRGLTSHWNSQYVPPPPSRGAAGPTIPPEPRKTPFRTISRGTNDLFEHHRSITPIIVVDMMIFWCIISAP